MKRMFFVLMAVVLIIAAFGVPVASAQRQLTLPILIVNTGNLNVRSGPGPQYSVITVAPGGTQLPALGMNGDGSWYLVGTVVGAGWVDVSFTIPRGDFRYVPVISAPTAPLSVSVPNNIGLPTEQEVPMPELEQGQIIVNTSRLNVRSGPGGQYTVVAVVSGGVSLEPLGVTADGVWFYVEGTFGRGWVNAPFVVFRGVYSSIPVIENAY